MKRVHHSTVVLACLVSQRREGKILYKQPPISRTCSLAGLGGRARGTVNPTLTDMIIPNHIFIYIHNFHFLLVIALKFHIEKHQIFSFLQDYLISSPLIQSLLLSPSFIFFIFIFYHDTCRATAGILLLKQGWTAGVRPQMKHPSKKSQLNMSWVGWTVQGTYPYAGWTVQGKYPLVGQK